MRIFKSRTLALVLVFLLIFSFLAGCSGSADENPAETADKPRETNTVSQKPDSSPEPTQSEDPGNTSSPTQPPSVEPNESEPPSTSSSPEPQDSAQPSPTVDPAVSNEPVQSETPERSAEPEQTDPPSEVFSPTENSFFPRLSSYEITTLLDIPTIQPSDSMMKLEFYNPITLYAATAPGKPATRPGGPVLINPGFSFIDSSTVFIDEKPEYTNGLRSAFVEKGGDEVLWFAWTSSFGSFENITWQISKLPFDGDEEDWKNPGGLLKSGTISKETYEFSVDFSKLGQPRLSLTGGIGLISLIENEKINPSQEILYVRAVATDASGNIIGEPGKGLEVLYGDRITYIPNVLFIRIPFTLLSGEKAGLISATGEFRNNLTDGSIRFYNTDNSSPWYFRPEGFSRETDTIYIQVTRVEPGTDRDWWRDPAGLVYEKKLVRGDDDFDNLEDQNHTIPIDIKSFAGLPPDLFYIRAVALSDGPLAGTVKAEYSKTVVMKYNYASDEYEYIPPPQVIYIDANVPEVKLIEYQPYRYQLHDWMYYYEVVRQPTYSEYYALMPESVLPNPDKLVEGLTPGTVIHLEPKEDDDDGWWDKVKDAISDAFGSITEFLADVTNWVSSKYTELRADLINYVAENLPGVPDEWRDELRDALEYMVDYGMAYAGIPPELPNFDELTNLGADYLAATALEQAGIPADEINKEIISDLGEEIAEHASAAASSGGSPNPMHWDWVRQYPEAMYRPAYLLIEVTNNSSDISPAGSLNGIVYTEITSSEKSDPDIMYISNAFGGTLYFELFRPYSLDIPPMYPGQTLQIPVYLQEYTGAAYSFNPHVVTESDFNRMYKHLGEFTFTYGASFDVQPLNEYIEENNLPPEGKDRVYEYTNIIRGGSFKGLPYEQYIP